jgi:hypothetical protein
MPDLSIVIVGLLAAVLAFVMMFLAISSQMFRSSRKKEIETPWREFAALHNLKYEEMDDPVNPGRICGQYHERWIELSAASDERDGFLALYMRLTVAIHNTANTSLTVRQLHPPTRPKVTTRSWLVSKVPFRNEEIMIAPPDTRSDADRRFLMMSSPEDYTMRLFNFNVALHRSLAKLHPTAMTLMLDKQLHFEQLGIERDAEYMTFLLDLMCDLADTVEKLNEAQRQRRTWEKTQPKRPAAIASGQVNRQLYPFP